MRELVRDASSFLEHLGHVVDARQEFLVFEDAGSLTKTQQTVVAGRASAISAEEVRSLQPNYVVVEDHTPDSQIDRLSRICEEVASHPELVSFSNFLDKLWQAAIAAQWARTSSEAAEDTSLPPGMMRPARPDPGAQYINQAVREEAGETYRALRYASDWVESGDQPLVVLAGAGLGKSELTRVVQWRAALEYVNRAQEGSTAALPPLAIRVRLRELPSLSLDAVVAYLRSSLHLDRLKNAQVLTDLLVHHRLVLLLDGLDELSTSRTDLTEGLRELARVAAAGGRLMITCRSGYSRSEGPLRTELRPAAFVDLQPLSEDGAIELLRKFGAGVREARRIWSLLPDAVRGVPLFLIWARVSHYTGTPSESKAQLLLDMVEDFCDRDVGRVLLSRDVQMDLLSDIAYHDAFFGPLTGEEVDILVGVEGSAFVQGPHALLRIDDGRIRFRYDIFAELFLARGIRVQWATASSKDQARFKGWIEDRVGELAMEPLTCEFLAQLITPDEFLAAWRAASIAPTRFRPYARRNLLAIALQLLDWQESGSSAIQRAERLAEILDGRNLTDTAFYRLEVSLLDFKGWDLRRAKGHGGHFAFCNFDGAEFDDQLRAAEFDDCTGLEPAVPEIVLLERGARRLDIGIRPWRSYAGGPKVLLKPKVQEDERRSGLDPAVVQVLRRLGVLEREQGEQGRWFLVITDHGKALLREHLAGNGLGQASSDLRELLIELAKLR